MMKRIALPFLLALLIPVVPTVAHAQRKSPLADAPAIRKRVELRDTRFEIGAGVGSTINETFYHGVMVNAHLAFHITDWLALGGVGAFDVSSISTGFHDRLLQVLPVDPDPPRTPSQTIANQGINKPATIGAFQLELTPFTGKYGVFGKLFAHYDFYVTVGGAAVNLTAVTPGANACAEAADPRGFCVVTGWKFGGTASAGFHSYFNDFLAFNVELRDVLVQDNPAGRDVNGDQNVNNGDLTWTSHLMATLGLTLYFPTTAGISP